MVEKNGNNVVGINFDDYFGCGMGKRDSPLSNRACLQLMDMWLWTESSMIILVAGVMSWTEKSTISFLWCR